MSMFTTDDRPECIDELEKVANLLQNGEYDYYFGMEEEVWEIARESKEMPHFSNIYTSIVFGRLEDALQEEFRALDIKINSYVNSIASSFEFNGNDVSSLEQIRDEVKSLYLEKKEHINSEALDDIKEKMSRYFDCDEDELKEDKEEDKKSTRRNK